MEAWRALDRDLAPSSPIIPVGSLPGSETHALRPCALAAVVALGLTALGLNPFVAALGAGFLAVAFYRRRGSVTLIRSGAGARLGAVSGILFFAMSTVLELLAVALLHKGAEIRNAMLDKIQQTAARYPGAEVQPFLDFVKSPGGLEIVMMASLIFGFVALILLGGLRSLWVRSFWGGAIVSKPAQSAHGAVRFYPGLACPARAAYDAPFAFLRDEQTGTRFTARHRAP